MKESTQKKKASQVGSDLIWASFMPMSTGPRTHSSSWLRRDDDLQESQA